MRTSTLLLLVAILLLAIGWRAEYNRVHRVKAAAKITKAEALHDRDVEWWRCEGYYLDKLYEAHRKSYLLSEENTKLMKQMIDERTRYSQAWLKLNISHP